MRLKSYISLIILISGFQPRVLSQVNWQESNLPDSISVYGIDFNAEGNYFITTNKGLLSSEDGFNWGNCNLSIPLNMIFINENNTIYTESLSNYYWSYDNGLSWSEGSLEGLGSPHCLYNSGDSITFIGTWSGGLYRTNDTGITWEIVIHSSNSEVFKVVVMDSQQTMYAGSTNYGPDNEHKGGIYKSEDFGRTWEQFALNYHYVSDIVISSDDKMFVTTSGQNFTGAYGIYRSEDYGWTWEMIYDERQSGTIDVNEYDELIVSTIPPLAPTAALLSTDNGDNWEDLMSNLDCNNIKDLKFTPDNRLIAICRSDDKLYYTDQQVVTREIRQRIFYVYPNPSSGVFVVYGVGHNIKNIMLYNIVHHTQKRVQYTQTNNGKIFIDITEVDAGIYLVEIALSNNEFINLKIIKK